MMQIREIVVVFRSLARLPHDMLSAMACSRGPAAQGGDSSTDVTLTPLTPKVIALFQSKISIFTRITGIANDMGLAVTVTISLQNKPDDTIW